MKASAPLFLGLALALGGCTDPVAPPASPAASTAVPSGFDEGRSGRYHSARFELSLVLAGGKEWAVDDHTQPDLVAVHAPSSSRLVLRVLLLDDLVNHRRCQAEAVARGLVPTKLAVLEETDEGGPKDFDTHIVMALEPPATATAKAPLRGHVLAFAAHVRRCLVFDFTTEVPAGAEATLGDRLAIATTRILPTIALDPSLSYRRP